MTGNMMVIKLKVKNQKLKVSAMAEIMMNTPHITS